MNKQPPSPWPGVVKAAIILGCTTTFCVFGLISGFLAAMIMRGHQNFDTEEMLLTVLMPPAGGALFGFFVGLVTSVFVKWSPKPKQPFTADSDKDAPPPKKSTRS
jgi:hypothetical protein